MTFLAVLAGSASNSTSSLSNVEPGLLGFLVVAALGVALVFILRSMNKQFKKLGPRPEDAQEEDGQGPAPGSNPDAAAAAARADAKRGA